MKDPYTYLENVDTHKTRDFYARHNTTVDEYLKKTPVYYFSSQIASLLESDVRGGYFRYGERTFWVERKKEWQKPKLMMEYRKEVSVLLDFEKSGRSLDYWFPSPKGTYLLYGTSENGNEQTTLEIVQCADGKKVYESIEFAGFTDQGNICWFDNEKEFIYPRMNGFEQNGPQEKWLLGTKLYRHRLGTDPLTDECVFALDTETVMLIPTLCMDNATLIVAACENELTHSLYSVDLNSLKKRLINPGSNASCSVFIQGESLYVLTNDNAPRYRLLSTHLTDVPRDFTEWDEILPETDVVLSGVCITHDRSILAHYTTVTESSVRRFDSYGNQNAVIPLGSGCTVNSLYVTNHNKDIVISYSGYTTPPVISRILPDNSLQVVWQREALKGDEDLEIKHFEALSADGCKIPYTYIALKNDVKKPVILYGYGGFNIALEPYYLSSQRPWLLAGGAYVVMNLRGGSEKGEKWHTGGSMENKQNTFNDCIAVAEDVIARGLATADTTGVMGGSNGGLLVAAVTIQRPDVFRAGVALVPLTDMLEFYKHQVAEFWVHEYGDPRIPEQRSWIEKWSPYHYQINSNLHYPALYYETALHDARVHPFHAFKMTARLDENVSYWKGPLLLRTKTDTGHQGSNMTKADIAKDIAEYYAFFATELGLQVPTK